MPEQARETIVDHKVFSGDGSAVAARLRVQGPATVDGTECVIVTPFDFYSTAPNPEYGMDERATLAADDLRIAIPLALAGPVTEPLCPECFGPNICRQTRGDEPDWGCLDCSASFEHPVGPERKAEPGYTVFAFYLDNRQPYVTDVYTWGDVSAAEEIAQRVCREDNQAETGEDLLRIVGVVEGVHAVHGGDVDGDC